MMFVGFSGDFLKYYSVGNGALQPVGAGATSKVFWAMDRTTLKRVVCKQVDARHKYVAKCEIELLAKLAQSKLVPRLITSHFRSNGSAVLIMQNENRQDLRHAML